MVQLDYLGTGGADIDRNRSEKLRFGTPFRLIWVSSFGEPTGRRQFKKPNPRLLVLKAVID